MTRSSDGHRLLVRSCRKVRHRLRLCVQQESHVPLIHQGEIVLELETELEPGLLIVVVLDRFRSKLQDFCDVHRRHITAPLPCASFACSVTRSATTEFQHNDIMMKTPVQNDLRLEMARELMWIVCAHESQTTKNNWKQACTCIELRSDKHITLSTQIWNKWPVSYKLMPETLRFLQSNGSGYCCTRSRDLLTSAISSSICGTRISSICFRFPGTYCKNNRYQQS